MASLTLVRSKYSKFFKASSHLHGHTSHDTAPPTRAFVRASTRKHARALWLRPTRGIGLTFRMLEQDRRYRFSGIKGFVLGRQDEEPVRAHHGEQPRRRLHARRARHVRAIFPRQPGTMKLRPPGIALDGLS